MSNSITDYTASLAYTYDDDPPTTATRPAPATKQVKPLDQQITELMRSLPPQLRDRPWSMAELVQRLQGKYRDLPHSQQVGEALLRCGWVKERRWEKGWDGRRIWLAPKD
jgi:hypothetical protein